MHRRRIHPPSIFGVSVAVALAALAANCADPAGADAPTDVVAATGPDLAIAWNQLAYEIAYAEDGFLTFKGQRAIALMHLAVHDALQAVVSVYSPYGLDAREPDADPLSAAAQAAHDVLLASYPDRYERLGVELRRWRERASGAAARELGARVGAASAQTLLTSRADDGYDTEGTYTFTDGPGHYRTTPPWDGFTLQPGFRFAKPLSFDDRARFRPAPPPPLDSPAYAEALNEVRAQGDSLSTSRTADQTGYAVWWMEFAESSAGRLVRRLLDERGPDLWAANRMLAHMYVALYDGYISNWDSKYEFDHWRPYTAIRGAAEDGNAATSPDPDWRPLRPTPPFPEYASAHATGCGAAYEVAARFFGDEVAFENSSLTAPSTMATRAFTSFRAAADECADSRVRLGWHFRYATDAGLAAGRTIARHVMDTILAER